MHFLNKCFELQFILSLLSLYTNENPCFHSALNILLPFVKTRKLFPSRDFAHSIAMADCFGTSINRIFNSSNSIYYIETPVSSYHRTHSVMSIQFEYKYTLEHTHTWSIKSQWNDGVIHFVKIVYFQFIHYLSHALCAAVTTVWTLKRLGEFKRKKK